MLATMASLWLQALDLVWSKRRQRSRGSPGFVPMPFISASMSGPWRGVKHGLVLPLLSVRDFEVAVITRSSQNHGCATGIAENTDLR